MGYLQKHGRARVFTEVVLRTQSRGARVKRASPLVPFHRNRKRLDIELALALPQLARGLHKHPHSPISVLIMIASVVLGFLVTVLVLIWPVPFTFDSSWFPRWISHRRLDEDASLLQLAEAFARRIERESAQIAEKINDPETINEVSRVT